MHHCASAIINNLLDAMGIPLIKQKIMYKVLTPSIITLS